MRLDSGPARAERNWQLLRTVIFLGFAVYFVYDGAIGWPRANRVTAEKKLAAVPFEGKIRYVDLGESPTRATLDDLMKKKPTSREQLQQALGPATLASGTDAYFISKYGYAKISVKDGRITLTGSEWTKWARDKEEIQQQFYWAIVPALPGLYFLWRLIKAVSLRVTIDDDGMVYAGTRIAFADMVSLRDYNPKGWIDLYFKAGEREKKLRLDNEKVRLFDEVVAALCEVTGFRNEVREYAEQKAREEAGEEEPEDAVASTPADEQERQS